MSEQDHVWQTAEDIQTLQNALADTQIPAGTRKALLKRASLSMLGVGGLGAILAGCGSGSSTTAGAGSSAPAATSAPSSSSSTSSATSAQIQKTIDIAATAEALAVTYLSAVIKASAGTPVAKFAKVLKAANAEEYDHYKALRSLGAKPLTTKFWAPDDFFGPKLKGVFPTLQVAETLFVNAYLIAMTTFANAGKPKLVRYAGEIAGVEAQHLALVRFADGKLPNDLGFADYSITSIGGIVGALEKAGVGFGAKGSKPGKFATFSPPSPDVVTHVSHTSPK
ncbi:MAG: hypothetical protein ACRDL8_00080 [Solirubrobacteraceae bacterium]